MVLIAVLWVISVLTLLASTMAITSVTGRRSLDRELEAVQARLSADSAVRLVLLTILNPPKGATPLTIDSTQVVPILGSSATVRLTIESGRIDLNAASNDQLSKLIQAGGWTPQRSNQLIDEIVARRGGPVSTFADSDKSLGAAGWPVERIPGAAFQSAADVRQLNLGRDLPVNVINALTVYTHQVDPILLYAPPIVRKAQSGGPINASEEEVTAPISIEQLSGGQILRLDSCMTNAIAGRCRTVVVRYRLNQHQPFQVFSWSSS